MGVGGLGHFGLLYVRTLGCERVVAILRTAAKKQDALAMGVDAFIAMDEDEAWNRKHSRSVDLFVQSLVWSLPQSSLPPHNYRACNSIKTCKFTLDALQSRCIAHG